MNKLILHSHEELFSLEKLFDTTYYTKMYPDVKKSGLNPLYHYLEFGWLEKRKPTAWFDTDFYQKKYLDGKSDINPFLHYFTFGQHNNFLPSANSLAKKKQNDEKKFNTAYDLLIKSSWFNEDYYRKKNKLEHIKTRKGLISYYILNYKTQSDPSPIFCSDFYRKYYMDLKRKKTIIPLVDYLQKKRMHTHYPNALLLQMDYQIVKKSKLFNKKIYLASLKRKKLLHNNPILDYLLRGQYEKAIPTNRIDSEFIREKYSSKVHDFYSPLSFYIRYKKNAWVYNSQAQLNQTSEQIKKSEFFNPEYYSTIAKIKNKKIEPAEHYAYRGVAEHLPSSNNFDTEFYFYTYPDIKKNGINPLLHYTKHGRKEGRLSVNIALKNMRETGQKFDPKLETIIVFSHEASYTGAPIVALNIVKSLSKTKNIISWIGKSGPLDDDFKKYSIAYITGWGSINEIKNRIELIIKKYNCDLAIVNSVVSHTVIKPLKYKNIPIISLIHEFADYVFPVGLLSRMAIFSDISIFPAKIVKEAYLYELSQLGVSASPQNLQICHQGYNQTEPKKSHFTSSDLYSLLHADPSDKKLRIVFGAGWVQPRKGVDLFLQTAQQLLKNKKYNWKFIWVGGNYNPKKDMILSVYLHNHIKKSNLSQHLLMLDEQRSLEVFWNITDIFFLPSRLDPFPNVALDALHKDIPVVCYQGATGIADIEHSFPFAVQAVSFSDPFASAKAIYNFAENREKTKQEFNSDNGRLLHKSLSFDHYINTLLDYAQEASQHQATTHTIFKRLQKADTYLISHIVDSLPYFIQQGFSYYHEDKKLCLAELMNEKNVALNLEINELGILQRNYPTHHICHTKYCQLEKKNENNIKHTIHFHLHEPLYLVHLMDFIKEKDNIHIIITTENPKIIKTLKPFRSSVLMLIDQYFPGAWSALKFVAKQCKTPYLSHCNFLFADKIHIRKQNTHLSNIGSHFIFNLLMNSPVRYLEQHKNISAVVLSSIFKNNRSDLEINFNEKLPSTSPSIYAENFNGTYITKELESYLIFAQKFYNFDMEEKEASNFYALLFPYFCHHLSNNQLAIYPHII